MDLLSSGLRPILFGLGALTLLKILYKTYHFLTFHFLPPSQPLSRYKSPLRPSYALVTGASAGIGLGIARALLAQGFNVILLGHLEPELTTAAETLRADFPAADVQIVVMNAINATEVEIKEMLSDLEKSVCGRLSVLVNNVGGSPVANPPFRRIWSYSGEDVDRVIDQNARFMAKLSICAVPLLQAKSGPEDRALVLNLSSAGWVGLPYIVMYSATKAFNLSFSISLARDLEADPSTEHIDCLCVVPADVLSQGNCMGVAKWSPTGDEFGRMVVERVDGAVRRGWRWMTPWWKHALEIGMLDLLPDSVATQALAESVEAKAKAWNSYWEKQH